MASEQNHISLANSNHDLLLHLLSTGTHPDWAATVAFYKAVHIAEAVFFTGFGKHSTSHSDREKTLKMRHYAHIFKDYSHLLTASRIARYLQSDGVGRFNSFADYMDLAAVKSLISKRLFGVEQKSLPFLSDRGRAQLKKISATP
jgi:hypothetical protein